MSKRRLVPWLALVVAVVLVGCATAKQPGVTSTSDSATWSAAQFTRVRSTLIFMDLSLENLPDDVIKDFAQSPAFDVYKRIFDAFGISGDTHSVAMVDGAGRVAVNAAFLTDFFEVLGLMDRLSTKLPEDKRTLMEGASRYKDFLLLCDEFGVRSN